ncbi:hypothetical protein BGZ51_009390 [Haplosporangium sp. Z 767]|nr:hypothetical protein BGZ51_009390 [Haplosporangium sp. Z 767]
MEGMESTNELGLRLEDIISPQLIPQLQAVRARQQATKVQKEEMKKRTRELVIAEDFEDCERELRSAWMELGKFIHPEGTSKKTLCTLEYIQGVVASLKVAVREVKGIDVAGAERRCNK